MAYTDNDSGLAYGWMMLCLYFGGAVLIWFGWTMAIDQLTLNVINPAIVAGTMSLQAVNSGTFCVNVVKYAPPVFLIFGFIYAVNRAVYAKGKVF